MGDSEMQRFIDQAVEKALKQAVEKVVPTLIDQLKGTITTTQPEYLSLKRAARLGDLSYDHVRRAVESGELPAGDMGTGKKRTLRIARSDFDRWMKKGGGGKELPTRSQMRQDIARYLPGVED